jgi:acyl-CoA thioester hydrolase
VSQAVSTVRIRVRYAETDQMGVAHHANYLVWCEEARTDHMRALGVNYRELEQSGIRLPVIDASVRYRAPAHYDDLLDVRCWVRNTSSRFVEFGYAVEREAALLATAATTLVAVDPNRTVRRLPCEIRELLIAIPDPVRL